MDSHGPNTVPRRKWNGVVVVCGKFLLAFALGIGAAVAGTFTTFETQEAHERDLTRLESMIIEKDRRDHARYLDLQRRLDSIMQRSGRVPRPLRTQIRGGSLAANHANNKGVFTEGSGEDSSDGVYASWGCGGGRKARSLLVRQDPEVSEYLCDLRRRHG